PATAARSRLRIGLIYVGAALVLVLVAAFARKTHESVISHNRGLKCLENKSNDCAIEAFNRAIASDPAFALAHHNLGVAYMRNKNYEQAINALQKSLELILEVGARLQAYHNLGLACYALSRYDEAIDAFKQSLQLNSQDPKTHFYLGLAYLYKESYDEAITA